MNEVRPKPEFLRPGPVPDAQEMIRVEEPTQERWARTRIRRMRERFARSQRQHRALLAYTAALGFVQVVVARLLLMGLGLKNLRVVDPMSFPAEWRSRLENLSYFAAEDIPAILFSLLCLLLASLAAVVVAWGVASSPKVDRVGPRSSKLRRGKRRLE